MGVVPPDSDQVDLEEASTITPTDAKGEPSEEKEGGLRAWGVVFGGTSRGRGLRVCSVLN